MCHIKAALGGAWKHTLQRVSSAAGFPSLSRGREPFKQPIMMQSAAVFAHAVSPSFLNCTIPLAAVELLLPADSLCWEAATLLSVGV